MRAVPAETDLYVQHKLREKKHRGIAVPGEYLPWCGERCGSCPYAIWRSAPRNVRVRWQTILGSSSNGLELLVLIYDKCRPIPIVDPTPIVDHEWRLHNDYLTAYGRGLQRSLSACIRVIRGPPLRMTSSKRHSDVTANVVETPRRTLFPDPRCLVSIWICRADFMGSK